MNHSSVITPPWLREIRNLLPVWLFLMAAIWFLFAYDIPSLKRGPNEWSMFMVGIGSALLTAMTFARGLEDGSILWEMLQPQGRWKLFLRKSIVLASAWLTFIVPYVLLYSGLKAGTLLTLLFLLAIVIPTVFWSLFLRKVLIATILIPLSSLVAAFLLAATADWINERWNGESIGDKGVLITVFIGFGGYSLMCGCLAWRIWKRMELKGDITGISSMDIKCTSWLLGDNTFKKRPAWLALLRKELCLQRYLFWLSGFLLVLLSAALGLESLAEYNPQTSNRLQFLKVLTINLLIGQTLLIPLLAGALSFGEENQQGSRNWQMTLPASNSLQWSVKLCVAFSLSLVLGLALPWLVLQLRSFLVEAPVARIIEPAPETLALIATIHLSAFFITSFCSSWSRTTVMAVMHSLFVHVVMWFVIAFLLPDLDWTHQMVLILWGLTFVASLILSWINSKSQYTGWRIPGIQLGILLLVPVVPVLAFWAMPRVFQFVTNG